MTQQPGSAFHVSALRYADASRRLYVGQRPDPRSSQYDDQQEQHQHQHRRRLDELFEKAEDYYRPGQSSSSSLLIRSNVVPVIGDETRSSIEEQAYEEEIAIEGFQRTKARALLAQTTLTREIDREDQFVGLQGFHQTGSVYLRNRRAKNPLSRQSYQQNRDRKRASRAKGKAKKQDKVLDRHEQVPEDYEEPGNDEGSDEEDETLEAEDHGERARIEELRRRLQVDAEELREKFPSGSLLETLHYLAAHYYDARGLLHDGRNTTSPGGTNKENIIVSDEEELVGQVDSDKQSSGGGRGASMLRVNEGSALVAMAVFLEELVKHEMASQPNEGLHQDVAIEESDRLAKDLSKLRKNLNKGKRQKQEKKRKAGKIVENGWAKKTRRRKAHEAEPARETFDGEDEDEVEDEDEDEVDSAEEEEEEDEE